MKYFAFIALINSANAVPVVGGITKEIACKDEADVWAGNIPETDSACVVDVDDIYKCSYSKPLDGDYGDISALDWSDTADQCATLFDTGAGDFKCVSAVYDGAGAAVCYAYKTSA